VAPRIAPTEGSTAAEDLAKLLERNEGELLAMGMEPTLLRSGLLSAIDTYRAAR